ncbi:MAG: hypothetical protein AAF647_07410 [Pseudomonadota bacterium]
MIALLVPLGGCLTVLGLCGLGWFIFSVMRARSAGLSDDALKERLEQLMPLNMAAVACAGIGLMMIVVGLFLA